MKIMHLKKLKIKKSFIGKISLYLAFKFFISWWFIFYIFDIIMTIFKIHMFHSKCDKCNVIILKVHYESTMFF